MVDSIGAGSSRVLVLVGDAGVGKSWLCARAVETARDAGCQVVATRGIESEAHLDYAGLLDVLSPLLDGRLERLAPPRRRAVEGALRLGDDDAEADPLAVGVACLELLAAAAEAQPLVVIVDDAHWADAASLQALRFAARRLQRDRVGVLFAARPEAARGLEAPTFETRMVPELTRREALALLDRLAGTRLDRAVADAIVARTGGNPLALEEAVRRLSPAQLAGRAPLPDAIPAPHTVQVAFEQRLRRLTPSTRAALVVVAVADSAPAGVVADALKQLELSVADLKGAQRAGLLADERVGFAHPLMRTAVLDAADVSARRVAHRVLAAAWERAGDQERAAWHLGAAADGRDAGISSALAAAARTARARGAVRSSAEAFRRAAETADDDTRRDRLLFEAAHDLCRSGEVVETLQLLDALAGRCAPSLRGDVDFLRAQALWTTGRLQDAYEMLVDGAARSRAIDLSRAVSMLWTAALTQAMSGNIAACVRTAERAVELARAGDDTDRVSARFALGHAQILAGHGDRAYPILRQNAGAAFARDPLAGAAVRPPLGQLACWMEDYDTARHDLSATIADARSDGAIRDLSYALAALTELEFRSGDWLAARAHGTEALELSAATDLHSGYAGVEIGVLEAVTGNVERARELLGAALLLGEQTGTRSLPIYGHAGLGLLELGTGELDRALEHLQHTRQLVRSTGLGEPNVVQWTPDLIETQVHLGRTADAERALAGFERTAIGTGRRWALATARRCRGMLASSADVDVVFGDADRLTRGVPSPFERARVKLCWGERLRRDGRRIDARGHLATALEQFEYLGAKPWADRAAREIRASGARARRGPQARSRELTPQETNVALLVAEGLTNKEVAARLFVSPKTVEFHLGNLFGKLDVRTRTQLARVLRETSRAKPPH